MKAGEMSARAAQAGLPYIAVGTRLEVWQVEALIAVAERLCVVEQICRTAIEERRQAAR